MKTSITQPFFYALGLTVHHPFTPALKYWNIYGDASTQELLPIDSKGTTGSVRGNGSQSIQIPSEPANDRTDIPCIALTGQEQLAALEWKRVVHAYNAEVSQMDEQLGVVLDEVDRQNLWSNTVIVFLADHGQHLGEHQGLWGKKTLFEESLHVPLIVYVPGKAAGVCSRLIEYVDVYPTLAELCGLSAPGGMEGTSFAPLFDNAGLTWKRAAFSQILRGATDMKRTIVTEQYRYTSWDSNTEELYDLNADPHEYTNLAGNSGYASVLTQMRTILSEGWTKSKPPSGSLAASGKSDAVLAKQLAATSASIVYPNPTKGTLYVNCESSNSDKVYLRIIDMTGRVILTKSQGVVKGNMTFPINLSGLEPGVYCLELIQNSKQERLKFVIER